MNLRKVRQMRCKICLIITICSIIPIAFTSESSAEIYDSFEGSEINQELWYTNHNTSGLLDQSGGFLTAEPPPYSSSGCIDSKIILYGDFEVILPWYSSAGEPYSWHLYTFTISDAFNPNYINEAFIAIIHDFLEYPYIESEVLIDSSIVVDETCVDNDFISFSNVYSLSGFFKITRVGTTINVFYNIGAGWILLTSAPNAFTCPVIFSIYAQTGDIGWSYVKSDYISFEGTILIAPTVSTSPATDVTKSSATLNGILTDDGGEASQYRFRYRDEKSDYLYTSWTGSVITGESFSEHISDLRHNKTYYFNAQARNSAGESDWGNEQSFVTKVTKAKEFMITFDDGPRPISTPDILDQLLNIKKADGTPVKAGFFLIGEDKSRAPLWDYWTCRLVCPDPSVCGLVCPDPSVIENPLIVQRIDKEGHLIGIHTQHHPDLWELTWPDVESEIFDCYDAIVDADVTPKKIFRSPYLHDPLIGLLGWRIIRGELTDDALPWVSEKDVIKKCKKVIKKSNDESPVILIFHDHRGLPSYRFNFYNIIVNELVNKEGFVLVDFKY